MKEGGETASECDQNSMSDFCNFNIYFMLFVSCVFLQSTYHPTNTYIPWSTIYDIYELLHFLAPMCPPRSHYNEGI